jgi:hypothetical protein
MMPVGAGELLERVARPLRGAPTILSMPDTQAQPSAPRCTALRWSDALGGVDPHHRAARAIGRGDDGWRGSTTLRTRRAGRRGTASHRRNAYLSASDSPSPPARMSRATSGSDRCADRRSVGASDGPEVPRARHRAVWRWRPGGGPIRSCPAGRSCARGRRSAPSRRTCMRVGTCSIRRRASEPAEDEQGLSDAGACPAPPLPAPVGRLDATRASSTVSSHFRWPPFEASGRPRAFTSGSTCF